MRFLILVVVLAFCGCGREERHYIREAAGGVCMNYATYNWLVAHCGADCVSVGIYP